MLFYSVLVMIKLVEPVIERQVSNIFADKNFKKTNERTYKFYRRFYTWKRELYKDIIKKIYIKWAILLDEIRDEANKELNN